MTDLPSPPSSSATAPPGRRRRGWAWLLFGVSGAFLGWGVGSSIPKRSRAHAVIRVANLARAEPAVPLSEVRARSEGRGEVLEALRRQGWRGSPTEADAYRVKAEVDPSQPGSIVSFEVTGPDPTLTLALTQVTVTGALQFSDAAEVAALAELTQQVANTRRVRFNEAKISVRIFLVMSASDP